MTERKKARNDKVKKAFRTAIKATLALIKDGKAEEAKKAYQSAQKALDKAAKAGIIKKNNAARRKSRIVRKIKALSQPKA